MIETLFVVAAIIALLGALLTVTAHNAVHALMYLVVTMMAIALIFFLIGSPFAAALQIIVYAGAIMVLFVFVTMMLHQGEKSLAAERQMYQFSSAKGALLLCLVLLGETLFMFSRFDFGHSVSGTGPHSISVKQLGSKLYGDYQLLVVIAALLLLSALISAIHIARIQKNQQQEKGYDTD